MSRCSLIILALAVIVLIDQGTTASYIDTGDQDSSNQGHVQDIGVRLRETCIELGNSCDNRPTDCCQPNVCRCNLWGTYCHCLRPGIF